jgi:hypothetical protein
MSPILSGARCTPVRENPHPGGRGGFTRRKDKIAVSAKSRIMLVVAIVVFLGMSSPTGVQALERGDLNGDQDITSVDAAMVRQIVDGTLSPTADQLEAADADQDGEITAFDAKMILSWASLGYGVEVPESFSEPLNLPVVESAEGDIGTGGGTLSLPSGVAISIPAGQTDGVESYRLDKTDPSNHDAIGNKTCYQVYPDPSYYPGSTMTIPYDDFLGLDEGPEDVEAVVVHFYDPLARTYRMSNVDFALAEDSLTVGLDQVRGGSGFFPSSSNLRALTQAARGTLGVGSFIKNTFYTVWVFVSEPFYINSQSNKEILKVPFYEQGSTPHCWATATSMAIRHVTEEYFVKPWEMVSALNVPDGLGGATAYGLSSYANFIKLKTGAEVEKSWWPKPSNLALKLYIKKQILDEHRPVILFVNEGNIASSKAHVVLVAGYEVKGGEPYLYIHNPEKSDTMYQVRSWDDIVSKWVNTAVYYAFVIPANAVSLKPITVYTLSKDDAGNSLAFVSPMEDDPTKELSNYRTVFNWYDGTTTEPAFLTHNGEGMRVNAIPNYYKMDLRLNLANASENTVNVKLEWRLSKTGGGGRTYSGEMETTLAPQSVKNGTSLKFFQDGFTDAVGDYDLYVEVYDLDSYKTSDDFYIQIAFDEGIKLRAERKTNQSGKTDVELTWDALGGFDGYYQAFKRTASSSSWQSFARVDPPNPNQATDNNYNEPDDTSYAVLARKDNKFFITSDVVKLKKLQGNLSYNYYYLDAQQQPHTGIGFVYLATGEKWEWNSAPNYGLLLLGVTPSGTVFAFNNDNVDDNDQILLRDNWGTGPIVDVDAPCNLAEGFNDLWVDEMDVTDAGNVYFTGTKKVEEEQPDGTTYTRYYDYVLVGDGYGCFRAPIDVNNDGEVNDDDNLDGFDIEQLTVSAAGHTLLLWSQQDTSLASVDVRGGSPVWLTSESEGAVKISDDGTRCLFGWYDEPSGYDIAVTMSTSGGGLVKLGDANGLLWTAEYTDLSSDGSLVCGYVVDMSSPNSEDWRTGLGIANSDGTGFRWLDTGTVVLQGSPKFSPDDVHVLFCGLDVTTPNYVGNPPVIETDIYMMKADGTEAPVNLTNTSTVIEANPYIQ